MLGSHSSRPKPARRTQTERRQTARDNIVQAAVALICERGCANASTLLIAERAQLSRGALQHHFPSRNDLLLAIVDDVFKWMDQGLGTPALNHRSIDGRVDAIVQQYWKVYGSRYYTAALEIQMNARIDPVLREHISARLQTISKARELEWMRLFTDTRLSSDAILAIRVLMLDMIRGMAVRNMIYGVDQVVPSEVSHIKALVAHSLARKSKGR